MSQPRPKRKVVENDMFTTHLPPIRCSENQRDRYDRMLRRRGDNLSRLVRQLLDEEYRKTFPEETEHAA